MLDTHALIWWLTDDERLPRATYREIADGKNEKLVSAASVWEIAIRHRAGKLEEVSNLILDISGALEEQGFGELPITVDDGVRAGMFPLQHRDPFDKMLIAQAISRNLALVSGEGLFDRYGVQRLWGGTEFSGRSCRRLLGRRHR